MESTVINNSQPYSEMLGERLSRVEQFSGDLYRELLGNGQPGRIQRLEDSVDRLGADLRVMVEHYKNITETFRKVRVVTRLTLKYAAPPGIVVLLAQIAHELGLV